MFEKDKWSKVDFEVLSYKEFGLLFVSGPTLFILLFVFSAFFPNTLPEEGVVHATFALQGAIAMYFVLKRNPDLDDKLSKIEKNANPFVYRYAIRSLIVAATTVGSFIIFGFLFYLLL